LLWVDMDHQRYWPLPLPRHPWQAAAGRGPRDRGQRQVSCCRPG